MLSTSHIQWTTVLKYWSSGQSEPLNFEFRRSFSISHFRSINLYIFFFFFIFIYFVRHNYPFIFSWVCSLTFIYVLYSSTFHFQILNFNLLICEFAHTTMIVYYVIINYFHVNNFVIKLNLIPISNLN